MSHFLTLVIGEQEQQRKYIYPRIDMLQDLLSSGNSIMMLTKDADGTLTYCYDCKSEEDFNDLISMEVK
nr:MAG TPA_asm: hypothetical protein [Caudoviricetes sp.]